MDQLRLDCLQAHNEYRAKHGVPPLTLNLEINEVAQKWSEHLAQNDQFEHSTGSGYGENLAGAYGEPLPDGRQAVATLYDEIKDYDFNNQGFSMETGHFTQVVWLASKELGIGAAKNSKGMWVMTFNYSPPGNVMGNFPNNVFREGEGPLSDSKKEDPKPEQQTDSQTDDQVYQSSDQPSDQTDNKVDIEHDEESPKESTAQSEEQQDIEEKTQDSETESKSDEKEIDLEEKQAEEKKKDSCCTIL